jgi:xanthine dehydrogenase/oxidase
MLRHTNSHALVNAGFRASVDTSTTPPTITSMNIVVGNITQGPFSCPKTASLVPCPLTLESSKTLCDSIKAECVPTPCPVKDPDFIVEDPEYRQNLTSSLLYKFFLSLMVDCNQSVDPSLISAASHYVRDVSTSSVSFDKSSEIVHQAIHKIEGKMQSSGEVEYCSDSLLPSGTLFAVRWLYISFVLTLILIPTYSHNPTSQVPVLATKSGVAIDSIDISDAMKCSGIVSFVSAKDLSSVSASNTIAAYTIFADSSSPVKHVGQIVGLLCGTEGFDATKRAVDKITIVYKTSWTVEEKDDEAEDVEAYTTGCKPAPSSSLSKKPDFSVFLPRDDDKTVDIKATKEFSSTISTTGQKHFYMETHSTLAVPNKSADSIVVTCATQCMTSLHNELSKTLGLKASNITVQTVKIGGAYGGKAYLPAPIAAATSIAALVTKQPVLCQLSRNDDMSALGGRPACSADFTVKVNDSTGEITDMKIHTTVDAGFDKSGGVTLIFKYTNHNAYSLGLFDSHLSSENKITNTAVNTIMRAPGDFQGALFTEAAVECAAQISGIDNILKVQESNLDKNVLPCWNEVKSSANVDSKQKDIDAFNASNRWRKRGMYVCGVKYLAYTVIYTEKVMLSVHSDGSVSVNSSGVEMVRCYCCCCRVCVCVCAYLSSLYTHTYIYIQGQGINTKVVQAVSFGLGKMFNSSISMDLISVVSPKSTTSFEGCSPTWGTS